MYILCVYERRHTALDVARVARRLLVLVVLFPSLSTLFHFIIYSDDDGIGTAMCEPVSSRPVQRSAKLASSCVLLSARARARFEINV